MGAGRADGPRTRAGTGPARTGPVREMEVDGAMETARDDRAPRFDREGRDSEGLPVPPGLDWLRFTAGAKGMARRVVVLR